jgi:peptidoglycan/xylan/chitin deacetylase (PgdA/CDA1 family)
LGGILLLGVLAAGVIAAGVKLWQDIDIQRLSGSAVFREPHVIPPALPPRVPAVAPQPYPAALFVSNLSLGFFADSSYYLGLVDRWEELTAETAGQVTRVTSASEIESLAGKGLLVAPSAVCLREQEAAALRNHAERGGGLVLSWAPGARDSDCQWLGFEAVARLLGTPEVRELEARESAYLTVPAGTALSAGFDPGTRVELGYESQMAASTGGPRVFWSDWSLNSQPAGESSDANAAAMTAWTEAGGRIVWFGFRLGQGARPEDQAKADRLVINGIRWAAELPAADITHWPGNSRSALLIEQDVESQFSNVAALADIAIRESVPMSFYVVSQLALQHPELADSLKKAGEIGSQTSDHVTVGGRTLSDQQTRLRRSWTEILEWTGDSAYGLRPPEERFDENTLRAWRDAGGTYVVGVNELRTAAPEVHETPSGLVVLLSRMVKDDFNVFVQESALRSVRLLQAYLDGMDKVRTLGGLAVISTHSQVAGEHGRIRTINGVIDSARADGDWWIATGLDIANWWLARSETDVQMGYAPGAELEVRVTAPAGHRLAGAWLNVDLPGYPEYWAPLVDGRPTEYVLTDWGMRIPLVDLPPRATTVVRLVRSEEAPALRN